MGILLKKPPTVAGSGVPAIVVGLFVAFGGLLFGSVSAIRDIYQVDAHRH